MIRITEKTFTRELMLAANNYVNSQGNAPTFKIVYVSDAFFAYLCESFDVIGSVINRANYQGYEIINVGFDDVPPFVIYLG